jgi:hypothetical protein
MSIVDVRTGESPREPLLKAMYRGTPVPEQAKGEGYDAWMPTGHAATWPTTMYSYC